MIRSQVKNAIAQAGNTKFILAPGCSLPTFSYPPMIKAARDAAWGRQAAYFQKGAVLLLPSTLTFPNQKEISYSGQT